jgi:hypothetical protein
LKKENLELQEENCRLDKEISDLRREKGGMLYLYLYIHIYIFIYLYIYIHILFMLVTLAFLRSIKLSTVKECENAMKELKINFIILTIIKKTKKLQILY